MPSKETVRRQRSFGGAVGVAVLGLALVYHFFPRVFHVEPSATATHRAMNLGPMTPVAPASSSRLPEPSEVDAGPPLTLAPTDVVVARLSKKNTNLPDQLSADTPEVEALIARADKALKAGQLAGDPSSAAALFALALKDKPDSRRAAQGLFEVRARLVAEINQDVAVGDADSAGDLLDTLKLIPDSTDDVNQLQGKLKVLTQVRPLLAKAAALLQQGNADQPAGNNALELYRQVQQLDPDNAVASQGTLQVQRAILDRALAAVAQNDFKAADQALTEAGQMAPDSQALRDVHGRVDSMRQARANGLLAQARSALDAGNLALAQQLADQAKVISPDLAGLNEFAERLTNARLYASYKPGQVFTDRFADIPGQTPSMLVIPTGSFQMGAPDNESGREDAETPQHEVTIAKGFALSRTSVTVGQFREFVRASGYQPDSVKLGGASVYDEGTGAMRDDSSATWQNDYAGKNADSRLPVVNVSWNDARAYVDWLSQRTGKTYRLPSEAEFEYALRGGTTTRYWWGDGAPTGKVENLTGSGDRSPSGRRWSNAFQGYRDGYWGPAPAMSFAPNAFGLYDMDGNVSEWVQDCWHDSYLRAPRDGSAWVNPGCGVRVVRGGSWGSSPDQVRSAYRQGADASVRSGRVGFRVLREL
ncbi:MULTISPECIES: SUMF1/EgtB/PvdO family nonheme iron enzyme [unclassified Dyella]|uniref:SUMF1/EgtB/PvdO family nonheme iron enzyme n=1 Tax=unclassified Dyella TaxID=2634549 RepID=UPI000C81F9CB|nr:MULTISPECIES: SUMF1/EgtB/PvdO family nonheme iron enzyme [unclassified Dyella]MDR3445543.1 SUMF1/EgtB/PvdO family nonheme iron enzyme [Dyella sp.]PMQ05231.1 Serine/threonine-protein kinase pkn1 [Dyella sp. AD56]